MSEDEDRRREEEEAKRKAFEAARLKALEDADRLRRDREAAEAARRAQDEADRLRREREAAEAARRAADEAERRRQEEADRRRKEDEDRRRREEEERRRREEEERRRQQPKFYEMEGILHKQTGEILTFVEAIRQGLLDLSSGSGDFYDIGGKKISLEEAVKRGLVDQNVDTILNSHLGIHHPETGQAITLREAIQIGLYDPDNRQFRDIHTNDILSLYDSRNICNTETQLKLVKQGILKLPPTSLTGAIEQNLLNTESGQFTFRFSGETMPLKDALYNEYVQISGTQNHRIAIPLSDAIELGLIDGHSGKFIDRKSGEEFDLRKALAKDNELLNTNVREIVNTASKERITLGESVISNAINIRQNNFTDLASRESLSLRQAFDNNLISKPFTLTEAAEKSLVDSYHRFVDKGTQNRWTLLEAIVHGVIDPDVRHIVDPEE
uniref:Uncharacterized protein n=1 Tax=Panagrolaimus sp. PS1159 TaxID=55785 RepID=A0AC35GAA9_9BILA